METLKLEHLKGYLGCGIIMQHNYTLARHDSEKKLRLWQMELTTTSLSVCLREQDRKPILHPLSSLTKEIEINGEKFVPIDILNNETYFDYEITKQNKLVEKDEKSATILEDIDVYPYWIIKYLLEWKFDIYGLIDRNLAIAVTEEFNPYK